MFVLIQWSTEGRFLPAIEETELLRVPFWQVELPRGRAFSSLRERTACRIAAARLRRLGVARAVFPEEFSHERAFCTAGILPVETGGFVRKQAAEIAQAHMEVCGLSPGTAVIAVSAQRMTAEVEQAVERLCIRNRYVRLVVPGDHSGLCRRLRREYGAAVVQAEGQVTIHEVDYLVCFDQREDLPEQLPVLELYSGGVLPRELVPHLPPDMEEQLPTNSCRLQLLSALWQVGRLRLTQCRWEAAGGPAGT